MRCMHRLDMCTPGSGTYILYVHGMYVVCTNTSISAFCGRNKSSVLHDCNPPGSSSMSWPIIISGNHHSRIMVERQAYTRTKEAHDSRALRSILLVKPSSRNTHLLNHVRPYSRSRTHQHGSCICKLPSHKPTNLPCVSWRRAARDDWPIRRPPCFPCVPARTFPASLCSTHMEIIKSSVLLISGLRSWRLKNPWHVHGSPQQRLMSHGRWTCLLHASTIENRLPTCSLVIFGGRLGIYMHVCTIIGGGGMRELHGGVPPPCCGVSSTLCISGVVKRKKKKKKREGARPFPPPFHLFP